VTTYERGARLTFYGWPDNDPPHSAAIAHPGRKGNPPVVHNTAGGRGTWADPITAACAVNLIKVRARIWVPLLRAYVIIEDTCGACGRVPTALDIWVDGKGHADAAVIACERALTPDGLVPVIFNPPSNHTVRTLPLFDGTCHR